jgi:hypothetical protein
MSTSFPHTRTAIQLPAIGAVNDPEATMLHALKQLLPLRYEATYHVDVDGGQDERHATWRMWLGRIFQHRETVTGGHRDPA